MKAGMPLWGMLMKRIDYRIAVSEVARDSAGRYLPGPFEIIPNGITLPAARRPWAAARTSSSTSAGTTRGRDSRCCCGPGREVRARDGRHACT